MNTSTPCRAADAAGETTASGRLWQGLVNALAIELAVALAVALLAGALSC